MAKQKKEVAVARKAMRIPEEVSLGPMNSVADSEREVRMAARRWDVGDRVHLVYTSWPGAV